MASFLQKMEISEKILNSVSPGKSGELSEEKYAFGTTELILRETKTKI